MLFDMSTLGSASLISQIGGGITSAIGSYGLAKSQKSSLKYQAALGDINARIMESGAQSALMAGQQQVGMISKNAGQVKGAQRASMAANGIDLGEGNAAEVQASTDINKELDMNTATANAVRSAWGYRVAGTGFTNDALMKRASAKGINPMSSAVTSLMGSAGNVAQSWYMMNKSGMFDTPSNDVAAANNTDDPIGALGGARGWWKF